MARFPTLHTADGDSIQLPHKWAICNGCRGDGKSSAYLGAFTGDQMREDPDFAADYIDGLYDRTCERCGGTGKAAILDPARTPRDQLRAYRAQQADEAAIREMERMERLAEGGWRDEIGGGY